MTVRTPWGPKHFALRLVKRGPVVAAKLWYDVPSDPDTGEPLDRSPRWQALLNGIACDIFAVIVEFDGLTGEPIIKGEEIDEIEYRRLLATAAWSVRRNPNAPEASPRTPIDMNRLPPIQFE